KMGRIANQDRRTRGAREKKNALAIAVDLVGCEAAPEELQGRVRDRTAAATIGARGAELGFHPPGADPEVESATRQLLNGGDPLGRRQRRPVRQNQNAGAQADAVGRPASKGG